MTMRFLRIFTIFWANLLITFGFAGIVYSSSFFAVSTPVSFNPGKPLEAVLTYKIDKKYIGRFKVRPKPSSGNIEILSNGMWLGFTKEWAFMPALSEKIELKSTSAGPKYIDLSLEVLDTETGHVYTTNITRIWDTSITSSYIDKLNQFIFLP